MRSRFELLAVALVGLLWLSGCGRADPTLLPQEPNEMGALLIQSAELLQAESWPVQVRLELAGILPSACHSLDYAVILPDSDRVIEVEAQARLEEGAECTQGEQPFRQGIGLGSYTEGDFQVLLNGEPVGEFRLGWGAQGGADDGGLVRGPVYVDETELIILESFPVQVELVIRGALPTPCASLEWRAETPDELGRIMIEAFSLQDPAVDCIQVLQEMEERLSLGSYREGSYSVWLNGELVGEFDV
ncbi:MAG: hypothetical protein BMS9Abin28_1055 [Anaerolineae bacterium]|nr:MAG: hypothetical protein BMS9Abin28_1055 [Anaerolineae bacterium]